MAIGLGGDYKLKSKEPKQPKEKKKSEAKPRKSSEKGKRVPVQIAADSPVAPPAQPSDRPTSALANGAADSHVTAAGVQVVIGEVNPSEEMIRMRAYELYVRRGYQHGHQLDDWLAAERELKAK